jgi:hypothetical protein
MKVFVLMGNDFPEKVFNDETDANSYCEALQADPSNQRKYGGRVVYWRIYPFDLVERSS